jgi:N-acetylneuraminate synthase
MTKLGEAFPDSVIGLSDHTTSNYTCLGAVALGASILERHFTDSMKREGPDIVCSMDPKALSDLIEGSRTIFSARGGKKGPVDAEAPTIAFAFASVVATKDLKPGEKLTEENIWVKRPGGGDFGVLDYDSLIGKEVLRPIKRGYQLRRDQIALGLST